MKIISLNIRHGGGKRLPEIVKWIARQNADFLVLTEWQENEKNNEYLTELERTNYCAASFSKKGGRNNGILVASKMHMTAYRQTPFESSRGEIVVLESAGLMICGAYFPQGNSKAPFFQRLYELSQQNSSAPFIIVGDLNTGNNRIDLEEGATKFACSSMFDDLGCSHGVSDLWRTQHGENAREWTWTSNKDNGFRIDHAFANASFTSNCTKINCWYDHAPRFENITDHSALIVEFYMPTIEKT